MKFAHGLNKRHAIIGAERRIVNRSRGLFPAYKSLIPACLLLVMLVLLPNAGAQENKSIGFVLEIVGDWIVDGTALSLGQALSAGGEVKAVRGKSKLTSTHIAIVLLDSRVIRLSCTKDKPCDPYRLPKSLVRSSTLTERIAEAAANIFGRRPERYVPAITRSDTDAPQRFVETIVKLQDGKIGMEPLMKGFPDGRYALSFYRIKEGEALTRDLPIALECQWKREELLTAVDQISPGLYSVTLRALTDSEQLSKTETSWVLVVSEQDYDKVNDDWRQIRDGVESWKGVSEAGKRSYLRLSLEFLSTQYK